MSEPETLIQSQQVTITWPVERVREVLFLLQFDAPYHKVTVTIDRPSVTDATVGVTQDSQQGEAMKHTPGPWIVEWTAETAWIGTPKWEGRKVDDIICGLECGPEYREEYVEQQKANARLIAAAPDMYEALKAHLAYCETGSEVDFNHFAHLRDKALRKAASPDAQGSVTEQSQQKSRQDGEA